MNNRSIGISVVSGSIILGIAVFFSAMVNSGLILQKEKIQAKENILTTTVGHVNLGKVYSESRGMNITLRNAEEKTPAAINLIDVDPNNFSKELHAALGKIAKDVNDSRGLTGDEAITPEHLSSKVSFKLNIKTYMNYRSEYIPMYTLMIKDEDIIIDKNQNFESKIIAEAQRIAKDSSIQFLVSSFIKT